MRVVAGEYGGRPLKSLPGTGTRPTSDKIKGALFNMIGPYFSEGQVLDLFAGSGGLGIEAVSRGCDHCVSVDKNPKAITIIRANVAMTKEPEKFTVQKGEANQVLLGFSQSGRVFDYIFLDPPYAEQELVAQLQRLLELKLVATGGLVICETDGKVNLPSDIPGLTLYKRKKYGVTEIVIYERSEPEDE